MEDYRQYYDLETYLFETVTSRFSRDGFLNGFDFFCIIIWKANRAKTKIAKKIKIADKSLDESVIELTKGICKQADSKNRLKYLINEKGFRLPMATAILTVLYPEEFTVYDIRVCNVLNKFNDLGNLTNFENIWNGYLEFCKAIHNSTKENYTLRDKDRYLWEQSFYEQLKNDISEDFQTD